MFGNLFIDVLTLLGVFILFGLIIAVLEFIIMIVQSFIKTFTRNKSSELRKNKNVINRYSADIYLTNRKNIRKTRYFKNFLNGIINIRDFHFSISWSNFFLYF